MKIYNTVNFQVHGMCRTYMYMQCMYTVYTLEREFPSLFGEHDQSTTQGFLI